MTYDPLSHPKTLAFSEYTCVYFAYTRKIKTGMAWTCALGDKICERLKASMELYTGLFISPSGISELDCTTTKIDTAERNISIGRECQGPWHTSRFHR